jgi:hypothetical protein
VSNIEKFAIEEDTDVVPASVKIYFEGTLAWYQIISPHLSYLSKFADMKLKAEIWLWIQHKRSNSILRPQSLYARTPRANQRWPTLGQVRRDLPPHFTSRAFDPMDTFHPYFIERIIQSHLSEETLAVGPEGIQPQWMECQLAKDLENTYPVVLLSRTRLITIGNLAIDIRSGRSDSKSRMGTPIQSTRTLITHLNARQSPESVQRNQNPTTTLPHEHHRS